jgi:ACS family tartrate transporter-like MFS transporter
MNLERSSVEQSTMRKVYWRLLPLTILTYFLCYLDRINVGFAALTMNKDLGLDAATYGMTAGAFSWGYFLFEVPSNKRRFRSCGLRRSSASSANRIWPAWRQRVAS